MRRRVAMALVGTLLAIICPAPSVCIAEGQLPGDGVSPPAIQGSHQFVQRTLWAMRWIEKAGWGPYVGQNLALIKEDPGSPFLGAMGLTSDGRAAAVFRSAPDDLWWLASAIVHEAAHAADMAAGRKFWGPEGEHAADLEQQRFLDALGCPMKVVRDPSTIADGPQPTVPTLRSLVDGRLRIPAQALQGKSGPLPASERVGVAQER